MISCEILPEGGIPEEWLRPISIVESPENFLVTLYEGESESGTEDGAGLAGEGEPVGEEAVPYELESGFEICVLPVPEEFSSSFDPQELLVRYEEFLREDPNWLAGLSENQGDWFHEQVTTASAYFEKLEFGTPGEANAFDHWFASNFGAPAEGTGEEGTDYGNEQPDHADGSWSFDLKDLLVRYEDFLRENPDWGALDPDVMETQVVTPSVHFAELEFGTPSKAAAFDGWYAKVYAPVSFDGSAADGEISDGSYGADPDDGSWSFDPKEFLARYGEFLGENPNWIAENQGGEMQLQVITASSIFADLEFNTPGEATAFDLWYAKVYAPVPVDGSGTDSGSINLSRPTDGEYGTVVSDNLYSGGKDFLETTGVITDTRNGLTGVPAEWMRGGAANTDGLLLSGGGPVAGGGSLSLNTAPNAEGALALGGGGTIVTGGEVVLSNGVTVDKAENNTLTLSNGSKVVLEGGQVVSEGKVYAYNLEFGSGSLPGPEAQLGAAELPTEIAITGGAVVEAGSPFGSVAAGLAPTPGEALIVEFSVLSPSEPLQAPQLQTDLHASDDLPQSVVARSGGSAGTSGADANLFAALDDATLDNALPHVAASAQEPELASNAGIKVDAPTAAAGAAAVGTVVHGGAAAPALRRPLPTL